MSHHGTASAKHGASGAGHSQRSCLRYWSCAAFTGVTNALLTPQNVPLQKHLSLQGERQLPGHEEVVNVQERDVRGGGTGTTEGTR